MSETRIWPRTARYITCCAQCPDCRPTNQDCVSWYCGIEDQCIIQRDGMPPWCPLPKKEQA